FIRDDQQYPRHRRSINSSFTSSATSMSRGSASRPTSSARPTPGPITSVDSTPMIGVFDGIDIDWERPGSNGNVGNVIRPEDKVNFTAMLAEFRAQLDAYGAQVGRSYTLSAFLPADPNKIDLGFEANKIFNYLDYASIQGYDLHGAWENQTNHHLTKKFQTNILLVTYTCRVDVSLAALAARDTPFTLG